MKRLQEIALLFIVIFSPALGANMKTNPSNPLFEVDGIERLTHRPLVALYEVNPWLTVIGSDVPTFVLYEDGWVIFHLGDKKEMRAYQTHISNDAAIKFAKRLSQDGFFSLPRETDCYQADDLPQVRIMMRQGKNWMVSVVDGIERDGKPVNLGSSQTMVPPPKAFVDVYLELLGFDDKDKQPWVPEQIELMLWDYSHSPETPAVWPKDLPPLPASAVPTNDSTLNHLIPVRFEKQVRDFLKSLGSRQAVEHNGYKWSISLRPHVPEEEFLRKVLDDWRKKSP